MRKYFSLLFAGAVLLLMTPLASSAQEWNAEQQGLIDHVTACWDAWVDALADETPAQFFDACPQDERGHWWWTADGAPEALVVGVQRNWHVIRETSDDWASLRPIYVDIFGDVGIGRRRRTVPWERRRSAPKCFSDAADSGSLSAHRARRSLRRTQRRIAQGREHWYSPTNDGTAGGGRGGKPLFLTGSRSLIYDRNIRSLSRPTTPGGSA
jgi:hypothetical protein